MNQVGSCEMPEGVTLGLCHRDEEPLREGPLRKLLAPHCGRVLGPCDRPRPTRVISELISVGLTRRPPLVGPR
jgi:hypothetical protein